MKIGNFEISRIQIIIVSLLIVGIIVGVYLVQKQQILKSKASSEDIYQQVEISGNGEDLKQNCSGEGNTYTCKTDSDQVDIDLSKILP